MTFKPRLTLLGLGVAALSMLGSQASAGVATGQIGVSMTINAACVFASKTDVAFGAQGILSLAVNSTGSISAHCTNGLPYAIALDAGAGTGATTSARKMTAGAGTISYALYRDSARTQNWGNTAGTDTLAGTGSGSVQTVTVYAQAPAQTTPAAGTYTDTVNVTITY